MQFLIILITVFVAQAAFAKNIDLSTVPARDSIQLTIYNAEDLTLVRESRVVSFKEGVNPLQFSWANTLIDPTSVEIKFLQHQDSLEVLDTTFPHDKPQMLYWNVLSDFNGSARVEITYFTSGISWQADYVAISNQTETEVMLESFIRVSNNSGEDYEEAKVRLVVGKVNLVQKIAELARVSVAKLDTIGRTQYDEYQYKASKEMLMQVETMAAPAMVFEEAKEVAKESFSEYFLYTIEGTETIPHGWSKRLLSFKAKAIPLKVQYRYRPDEYGDQLVRLYLMKNDQESHLGNTPLPDGTVRIFRQNERGGLGYVANQTIQYIPIGDDIELNLGVDPNVIFELVKLKAWRDEVLLRMGSTSVYKKLDKSLKIETNAYVVGWDEHTLYSQRIRNFSQNPIEVEIRRSYYGDIEFKADFEAKNHDYKTVEFTTTVDKGETKDLLHEIIKHEGKNSEQEHVKIVK